MDRSADHSPGSYQSSAELSNSDTAGNAGNSAELVDKTAGFGHS